MSAIVIWCQRLVRSSSRAASSSARRTTGACFAAVTNDSICRAEREGEHCGASACPQLTGEHRQSPATEARVVDQQARSLGDFSRSFERTAHVCHLRRRVLHLALWRAL